MSSVKTLVLKNYRNHEKLELHFGDGINLIVGGNAQGKTNVLESIYLLGRRRSFRVGNVKDLIRWGESECFVEAELLGEKGTDRIHARLAETERQFKLNGKKKRIGTALGVVLFAPQDINIFREQPHDRREYLNEFISLLDGVYKSMSREYSRILVQRNRTLRDIADRAPSAGVLAVWDQRLVDVGSKMVVKRKEWIDVINSGIYDTYKFMGGVGKNVFLSYEPNVVPAGFRQEAVEEAFRKKLDERRDLESIRCTTLVGPHRDDWSVIVDDHDLKLSGSQGQMRVMAISLKVTELKMIGELFNEVPVLLLDDVISELDKESSAKLLDTVSALGGQVIITTTSEDLSLGTACGAAKVHRISGRNAL